MTKPKVHLLIVDPQQDFMDDGDAALPVPGANADMRRLARMIRRVGGRLNAIHITLDSHHVIDVAHPGLWLGDDGKPPLPFTVISADDIEAGRWRPRIGSAKPALLGGQTLDAYMFDYARGLERRGNYPLMIWPEHCIIGSVGHAVHAELAQAVHGWERAMSRNAGIVTKGTNIFTEHYGALMAELPLPSDPSTDLNTALLAELVAADVVAVAGEALSHCVKATVTQIVDHIGEEHVAKIHLLTDCTSPIPKVGHGPDFPAISASWLSSMAARGLKLVTSEAFLS